MEQIIQAKTSRKYTYGQVPALFLDDGTQLCQTQAILRYIAKVHKGPKGEIFYPGPDNA